MASNTPIPTSSPKPGSGSGALSFMTRLSPSIYHFRPPRHNPPASRSLVNSSPPTIPGPPELIILASWMGARDAHIAKYIHPYRTLYPTAEILLIRSEPMHFIQPFAFKEDVRRVALPVLRGTFPDLSLRTDGEKQERTQRGGGLGLELETPRMHVHLLSGGGSLSFYHVRTLLDGNGGLPPHTVVYDSAPPQYSYRRSVAAFSASIPRSSPLFRYILTPFLLLPLLHLFLFIQFLHHRIFSPNSSPLSRLAVAHNERRGRAKTELRRVYIYGEADELVRWEDVEAHAEEGRREGFTVKMDKFDKGGHVSWMRADPERYWGTVRGVWEGWGEGER